MTMCVMFAVRTPYILFTSSTPTIGKKTITTTKKTTGDTTAGEQCGTAVF